MREEYENTVKSPYANLHAGPNTPAEEYHPTGKIYRLGYNNQKNRPDYAHHAHSPTEFAQKLIKDIKDHKVDPKQMNFSGVSLAGADLRGLDLSLLGEGALSKIDFSGADLSGQNFAGMKLAKFHAPGAIMNNTNFSGATMREANLDGANFGETNFDGANLGGASMIGAKGAVNFSNADLGGASLTDANFSGGANNTSFRGAKARKLNLARLRLTGSVDFADAELEEVTVTRHQVDSGIFANSHLVDPRILQAHGAKAQWAGVDDPSPYSSSGGGSSST
jgi:uncharacterized protein YjbI with pentapeptide repeats